MELIALAIVLWLIALFALGCGLLVYGTVAIVKALTGGNHS